MKIQTLFVIVLLALLVLALVACGGPSPVCDTLAHGGSLMQVADYPNLRFNIFQNGDIVLRDVSLADIRACYVQSAAP